MPERDKYTELLEGIVTQIQDNHDEVMGRIGELEVKLDDLTEVVNNFNLDSEGFQVANDL